MSLGNSGPGRYRRSGRDSNVVPGDVHIKPVVLDFNAYSPGGGGKAPDSGFDTPAKQSKEFQGDGNGSSTRPMPLKRPCPVDEVDIDIITPKKKVVKTMVKGKIEMEVFQKKPKVTKAEKVELSQRTLLNFFQRIRDWSWRRGHFGAWTPNKSGQCHVARWPSSCWETTWLFPQIVNSKNTWKVKLLSYQQTDTEDKKHVTYHHLNNNIIIYSP